MNLSGHAEGAVRRWLDALDPGTRDSRLSVLGEFCARVGRAPDELVNDCLRRLDSGRFTLRTKARQRYISAIAEFEAAGAGRAAGNVVRSFFIHNGIPMQAPLVR
jgi:hypothetical protein